MKNIHVLPTNRPSRLYFWEDKLVLGYLATTPMNRNIYITFDEEIKQGDWFMSDFNSFPLHNIKELSEREGTLGWKQEDLKNNLKIILTTDQDLIKDGVQAIDDEFLEWFVKNPSCESVDTKLIEFEVDMGLGESCIEYGSYYKIIIPKEEPKQETLEQKLENIVSKEPSKFWEESDKKVKKKETLKEAELAILFHNTYEKLAPSFGYETRGDTKLFDTTTPNGMLMIAVCREIIKWQQERMYSEEEVKQIIDATLIEYSDFVLADIPHWFEQFKKK